MAWVATMASASPTPMCTIHTAQAANQGSARVGSGSSWANSRASAMTTIGQVRA